MLNGPSKDAQRRLNEELKLKVAELETALNQREEDALEYQKTMDSLLRRESELRATLYGIGDGVISTDARGTVTRMNQVAEKLTGWAEAEAAGKPLEAVFHIINETTRCKVDSPVDHVLCEGVVCGLANHTLLVSRDGREIPIADSAAPILDSRETITGVVLIFRDQSEERLTQRLTETRLSLIEYAAGHSLDELLSHALGKVEEFVQSPIGFYHFMDADQTHPFLQKWSSRTLTDFCRVEGEGLNGSISLAGVWADCVREKRAVMHNDLKSHPNLKGMPEGHVDVFRELVAPVMREGRVVAILGVGNKPDAYTEQDASVVSFLADVIWNIVQIKIAEQERLVNLRFFESMDKVNRAMLQPNDFEQMMRDVLDVVLSVFDCDRTFLLYPCDPEAPSWFVAMQCTRPEYPGHHSIGKPIKMEANVARIIRTSLDVAGPVAFCPGSDYPPPDDTWEKHRFRSQMTLALYPKVGGPWLFGLHQCSDARVWTPEDINRLNGIGMRMSDCLTGMLMYRDLRKSEGFLDNIVEHIPSMISVKDAETLKYLKFNKAGENLLGYAREELLGKSDYELFPKEVADLAFASDREALVKNRSIDIPEEVAKYGNSGERIFHTRKIPIPDDTGTPQYLLGISEDITVRKRLEQQLQQSQKMEAVGQLAGGLAHDFNNMLSVIMGHVDLPLADPDLDGHIVSHLESIRKAAERSAALTQQLLAFARKQTIAPRVLDLNAIVEGMLKMLRRLIGEGIKLVWLPGQNLWTIMMDPSQIDQILINLCINARDAVDNGGRITIETKTTVVENDCTNRHAGREAGEYVQLVVSDDGHGMDEEILGKVFEPFFTTKATGRGTGLGLATVYGIVQQNSGFINLFSEPGRGTTFEVHLPRNNVDSMTAAESVLQPVSRGTETILLVEDEPTILDVATLILEQLGYRVLAASMPEEAIRLAEKYDGDIDLLITDVIMPQMNGRQLSDRLLAAFPNCRRLFMSGYTGDIIAPQGVLEEGMAFIQKPFSVSTLAAKVREVLAGEP